MRHNDATQNYERSGEILPVPFAYDVANLKVKEEILLIQSFSHYHSIIMLHKYINI